VRNTKTSEQKTTVFQTIHFRRLRAALAVRGSSVEAIARAAKCTSRHVWFVLARQRRPSISLVNAIRAALGESGWAFATGQTDALQDEGVSHAA